MRDHEFSFKKRERDTILRWNTKENSIRWIKIIKLKNLSMLYNSWKFMIYEIAWKDNIRIIKIFEIEHVTVLRFQNYKIPEKYW